MERTFLESGPLPTLLRCVSFLQHLFHRSNFVGNTCPSFSRIRPGGTHRSPSHKSYHRQNAPERAILGIQRPFFPEIWPTCVRSRLRDIFFLLTRISLDNGACTSVHTSPE